MCVHNKLPDFAQMSDILPKSRKNLRNFAHFSPNLANFSPNLAHICRNFARFPTKVS